VGRAPSGLDRRSCGLKNFVSLKPNRALLKIARQTGGEALCQTNWSRFVTVCRIVKRQSPKAGRCHCASIGGVSALRSLLIAEWGLRRWKGLA